MSWQMGRKFGLKNGGFRVGWEWSLNGLLFMNGDSPDFFDEDSWDEEIAPDWKEGDWQRYLADASRSVERFIRLYRKTRRHPEHLDLTAHLMGWNTSDWTCDESFFETERGRKMLEALATERIEEEPAEEDPYTLHQHPVFIAARALYHMIGQAFERELKKGVSAIPAIFVWDFSRLLSNGERSAVLATQSVDMGDLDLGVIHFKQLLASVNASLGLINVWEDHFVRSPDAFAAEARTCLFDLREIALRVIYECRQEVRRPPSDEE